MAKYRQVHVEFWQDGFVLDLTPEEKYFYIYLMTNSKTSQCGIYELPKRIIETETGYNRETVDKLLNRFIEYGKIKFDDSTKELFITNWIKYNAVKSPKVIACIKKELGTIKNKQFVREFIGLCKQYGYGIDTLSIDYGEEEEVEEEKEEEKEREEEAEEEESLLLAKKTLLQKFISLRGYGFDHSPKDDQAADEILESGVNINDAILWLEERFNTYEPKHSRDKINSLNYCVGFILDKYYSKLNGGEKNGRSKKYRSSNGRAPKKSPGESITGNQVGWLGKRD
ncbi:hypothetical protein [Niallia sp. FSL W8-1348]|uniref:hypothetical protein n=1 Tax=Niallia sp. FSL W8-1348 TaxID=2954656 RepID=UPI0030FB3588